MSRSFAKLAQDLDAVGEREARAPRRRGPRPCAGGRGGRCATARRAGTIDATFDELDGRAVLAAGCGARRGCRRGRGPSPRGAGGRRSPRRASGSRKRETSSSPPTRMRSAEPMSLARSPRSAARSRSIVDAQLGLVEPERRVEAAEALRSPSRACGSSPRSRCSSSRTGPWITKSMSHDPPPMLNDG